MTIGVKSCVVGHDSYLVTEAIFSNFPTYQANAIASKCQSCLKYAKTHVEYKVGSKLHAICHSYSNVPAARKRL